MIVPKTETAAIVAHRDSIFVEDGRVISRQEHPAGQYVLRVHSPRIAETARPGMFAHVTCDPELPMRRPLSIMRTSESAGWIEFYFKLSGHGLTVLAARAPDDVLSMIGPIGNPFAVSTERPRPLLIGGGVGSPPMIFLAEELSQDRHHPWQPLLLLGSEIPFPYRPRPSQIVVPGMPAEVIAAMPLGDDFGVASRLAAGFEAPGCYHGHVTELAREWLATLSDTERNRIEIFACGPTPMLIAAAAVAREFGLPCQVSLEEFMACAVGGCAGCTVLVQTESGPAMKRVCVDGPVFDAYSVFTE